MANDKKKNKSNRSGKEQLEDKSGLGARPADGKGGGKGSLQADETDDIGKDGRPGERGYVNPGTPNQGDRSVKG